MNTWIKILRRVSRETWLSVASVIFLLALWEIFSSAKLISSPFVVAPSTIVISAVNLVSNGKLIDDIGISLLRMFAGFFIGTAIGLILGMFLGWSKIVRALLNPWIWAIYPLPKIALLPLIILLIGIGEKPIIMLIALGAFFPVVINCIAAVIGIDRIYFDAAKNYGASRYKTFTRIILPASLPVAFVGIKLAIGMSLLLTVVAELAMAGKGIGAMLWISWQTLQIENIYIAIVVIAILGLLLSLILSFIGRRLSHWQSE